MPDDEGHKLTKNVFKNIFWALFTPPASELPLS